MMRLPVRFGRVLFPHFCLACGHEGHLLCPRCESSRYAPSRGLFFCLSCGRRLRRQTSCSRKSCTAAGWGRGFAVGSYGDPVMRGLLHLYKYGLVDEAGETLSRLLAAAVGRQAAAVLAGTECPVAVPVPMHPVNRAWRGFNQAESLAGSLAVELEMDLLPHGLSRRMSWWAQARTVADARREQNVSGMFRPGREASELPGRDVVLVDDVFTTGSTVRECVRTLRSSGAGTVSSVALLLGGRPG